MRARIDMIHQMEQRRPATIHILPSMVYLSLRYRYRQSEYEFSCNLAPQTRSTCKLLATRSHPTVACEPAHAQPQEVARIRPWAR